MNVDRLVEPHHSLGPQRKVCTIWWVSSVPKPERMTRRDRLCRRHRYPSKTRRRCCWPRTPPSPGRTRGNVKVVGKDGMLVRHPIPGRIFENDQLIGLLLTGLDVRVRGLPTTHNLPGNPSSYEWGCATTGSLANRLILAFRKNEGIELSLNRGIRNLGQATLAITWERKEQKDRNGENLFSWRKISAVVTLGSS